MERLKPSVALCDGYCSTGRYVPTVRYLVDPPFPAVAAPTIEPPVIMLCTECGAAAVGFDGEAMQCEKCRAPVCMPHSYLGPTAWICWPCLAASTEAP